MGYGNTRFWPIPQQKAAASCWFNITNTANFSWPEMSCIKLSQWTSDQTGGFGPVLNGNISMVSGFDFPLNQSSDITWIPTGDITWFGQIRWFMATKDQLVTLIPLLIPDIQGRHFGWMVWYILNNDKISYQSPMCTQRWFSYDGFPNQSEKHVR